MQKAVCSAGPLLDYTVLTLCFEEPAMTAAALPAERLQDEELLVIRESARLMGKSLEPGPVIREMLHLISEFLGLNRGRVVLRQPGGDDYAIRYAYGLTQAEIERGVYRPGDGVPGACCKAARRRSCRTSTTTRITSRARSSATACRTRR
jgi:hypothetical protein